MFVSHNCALLSMCGICKSLIFFCPQEKDFAVMANFLKKKSGESQLINRYMQYEYMYMCVNHCVYTFLSLSLYLHLARNLSCAFVTCGICKSLIEHSRKILQQWPTSQRRKVESLN